MSAELVAIEADLAKADTETGLEMIRERRLLLDTKEWIDQTMPRFEHEAGLEKHAALVQQLNEHWQPLAERRVEAVGEIERATKALVAALEALRIVHDEQHETLDLALEADRTMPGATAVTASQLIMRLQGAWTNERVGLREQIRQWLPAGSATFTVPDTYELDATEVAYRSKLY